MVMQMHCRLCLSIGAAVPGAIIRATYEEIEAHAKHMMEVGASDAELRLAVASLNEQVRALSEKVKELEREKYRYRGPLFGEQQPKP